MEREEAQNYNNELFRYTGVRYKCNTIRDYYLIKVLYELFSIYKADDIIAYYDLILDDYFDKTKVDNSKIKKIVKDKTVEGFYYNYGYTQGLYQYWLKYYYPTCLNFVSFLAIYSGEELDYTVFENTTTTALNKTFRFMENQSIDMIRNEMSILSDISDEYKSELGYKIKFIWHAKQDEKTCKTCWSLNGKKYNYAPDKAHANCRCTLELRREYEE